MFFDNALTCPNHNGTEPQFPWDICPPPTADTTLAVIPFGKQPTVRSTLGLQCSLVLIPEKRSFENVRGKKVSELSFSVDLVLAHCHCHS